MRSLLLPFALVACTAPPVELYPGEPFSPGVIPDIQYVTLSYPSILVALNECVAAGAADRYIHLVLQEGDTWTFNGARWARVDTQGESGDYTLSDFWEF